MLVAVRGLDFAVFESELLEQGVGALGKAGGHQYPAELRRRVFSSLEASDVAVELKDGVPVGASAFDLDDDEVTGAVAGEDVDEAGEDVAFTADGVKAGIDEVWMRAEHLLHFFFGEVHVELTSILQGA